MPWEFDLDDFEDGQGAHEQYDALQDVKQTILNTLRLEENKHLLALLQSHGSFKVKVKGDFVHKPGDPKPDWGTVQFEIQQMHYAKIEGPAELFVSRNEVWKQLPYLDKPNPRLDTPEDWTIDPPNKTIEQSKKWEKYKSKPMVEWAQKAIGQDWLLNLNDHQFAKTFGLVGEALFQPHFRFFSHIAVTGQGYHTSKSDPKMHATVKLRNSRLDQEDKAVIAHIYNDEDCHYIGHRIFIGTAQKDTWHEFDD